MKPGRRAFGEAGAFTSAQPERRGVLDLLRDRRVRKPDKLAKADIIAIEMRAKDGGTGAIVAMMADRESAKAAPIDVQAVTW